MYSTLPGPRLPVWLQTLCYGFRPVSFLHWCQRRYGDVFVGRLPGDGTMVVLADPAIIREVMALGADDFTVSAGAPMLEPFLGSRSLLLLDGERHKVERKALVDGLHGATMSEYAATMVEATRQDLSTWPVGRPFALHPHLQAITLEVIARLIFGADDEATRSELVGVMRPWLAQNVVALLWEPMRRDFGGHGPWARFVARRRLIDEALDRQIAARRKDPDLQERRDVLSILLAHDVQLDDLSLRDQLMTMLTAGHDTSATALAWAFALVLRHPRVLERLIAEMTSGDDAYLDAVVKEVLRLTPVILEVGRTMTHDVELSGIRLPAGATAVPSILLVHHRAEDYADPQVFRPERFLERPMDILSWMPFGGGIRRCIGAAFATLEIKTVLRTVLSAVELHPVGRMEKPRRRAVTMIPSQGTRVVLVRHNRSVSKESTQAARV